MSSRPLFQLEDLSYAYSAAPVLHDIRLNLEAGRFYGVIGPNGSGKTTLLDLLSGGKKPLTGTISFKGRPLYSYSRRDLARELSLVPQEFDTGFGFTVEEVVLMGRHPHIDRFSSPSKEDWQAVDRAMRAIGIEELRHRYTNSLSGGQKQRAVVARALAQNTQVLLFDEATSSLDIKYSLQIFNLARQLVRGQGRTVIAVIHNLNFAAAYCDYTIFIKDGQLIRHGTTDRTLNEETIREVFDVRSRVSLDPFNGARQVHFQYWE